jgi:hypothetical protein
VTNAIYIEVLYSANVNAKPVPKPSNAENAKEFERNYVAEATHTGRKYIYFTRG